MTFDGYTIAQLRQMHRAAFEDASDAFDGLFENLGKQMELPYPSAEHAAVRAQQDALRAAVRDAAEHLRALRMEIETREAEAEEAALDKIEYTALQCLHSPN